MSGARFIMNARFFHVARPGEKISKYALSPEHIARLVEYCGTRESVALNIPEESRDLPATKKQTETLKELFNLVDDYKETLEYDDYIKAPTRQNASELISRLSELLLMSGTEFDELSNLVEYAAKRPGVVKVGEHGLFSSFDNVDLKKAQEEISTHKGNIWTEIYSLRREDAANLSYDSQKPWRDLVMANVDKIAEAHHIKAENLRWYAAMHNTAHHPHIHLFVYSTDPTEGYLGQSGIKSLKSAFATNIFKNERAQIYQQKDYYKKQFILESKKALNKLLANPESSFENNELNEIANKMLTLSQRYIGKATYGWQPKEVKEIVNDMVHSLVSNNSLLSELYGGWVSQQFNIERIYKNNPNIDYPIERNPLFLPVKNIIMKQAKALRDGGAFPESPAIDELVDIEKYDFTLSSENPQHITPIPSDLSKFDFKNLKEPDFNANEHTYTNKNYHYSPFEKYMKKYPEQIFYSSEPEEPVLIQNSRLIFESDDDSVKNFKSLSILANDFSLRTGEICRNLADCYNYGQGTEKDFAQAVMWYGIAADQFQDSMAAYKLGQIYTYGTDNIEIDKQLGEHYFIRAYGLFKNEIKNYKFYIELESGNDAPHYFIDVPKEDAYKEYLIGRMYLKGEGVWQDYFKAYRSFLLASDNGYKHANYYIGNQYYYGLGFNQDYEKALTYYQKASKANDSYADYRIAKMYLKGEGVNADIFNAEKYFIKASNKVTLANYDLAKLYENNFEAFNKSEDEIFSLYQKALEQMLKQEQNGHDVFTEMRIASMYLNGKGTDINISEAVSWLEKAAKQDNPDAAYQLGYIYSTENYDLADLNKSSEYYAKALSGYEKAEETNNNATAEYRIGLIYLNELGIEKDIDKALHWLNKSALNGNSSAAYKLAILYEDGKEVTQNDEKAFLYYQISAEQGNPYACYKLGNIYLEKGDIQQAITNFEQAAEENISHAWYKLGQLYSDERHGVLDYEKSNLCYSKALQQYISDYNESPDSFTAYRIGLMYLDALGTSKDISQATDWLEKAAHSAEPGNPYACYKLGNIYLEKGDIQQAITNFEQAAEENISHAWYKLGQLYSDEQYGVLDYEKSNLCYSKALQQYISDYNENPDSFTAYRIGLMYLDARGTNKDISQAIGWLNKSVQQDNPDAAYQLGYIYKSEKYGLKNDVLSNKHFNSALSAYLDKFNKNPLDGNLAMRIGTFYNYGLGVEHDINKAIYWYKKAIELGNRKAQQKVDEAQQTRQMSVMSVATTACHLGRMLNTETIAAAKNRYISDTKLLRKEKIQKIHAGQAISDSGQSYDY